MSTNPALRHAHTKLIKGKSYAIRHKFIKQWTYPIAAHAWKTPKHVRAQYWIEVCWSCEICNCNSWVNSMLLWQVSTWLMCADDACPLPTYCKQKLYTHLHPHSHLPAPRSPPKMAKHSYVLSVMKPCMKIMRKFVAAASERCANFQATSWTFACQIHLWRFSTPLGFKPAKHH